MLPNGTANLNGNTNLLDCPSDYELRPAVDLVAKPAAPEHFTKFTHNLGWVDPDGISHSMTIRTNDPNELWGLVSAVKHVIRASKGKAATANPEAPEPDADVPACKVHGTPMQRKQSKRTGGIYFSHALPNGELCFGRPKNGKA